MIKWSQDVLKKYQGLTELYEVFIFISNFEFLHEFLQGMRTPLCLLQHYSQ